jgi:hypothetical protein
MQASNAIKLEAEEVELSSLKKGHSSRTLPEQHSVSTQTFTKGVEIEVSPFVSVSAPKQHRKPLQPSEHVEPAISPARGGISTVGYAQTPPELPSFHDEQEEQQQQQDTSQQTEGSFLEEGEDEENEKNSQGGGSLSPMELTVSALADDVETAFQLHIQDPSAANQVGR